MPPLHPPPPPANPGAALLGESDPAPAAVVHAGGRRDLLLLGDHAGNAIPARLGDLGLPVLERTRHIAWDVGVRALGENLADRLGATFVHQPFSRLVIDCNREPQSPEAILPASDGVPVPGNTGLDDEAREQRRLAIHAPYHARIAAEIAARRGSGRAGPLLVSLHSFVPVLGGRPRPWHIGVLHDAGDTRASRAMLRCLTGQGEIVVGDNQPYRMDSTDYTIPHHAYAGALPYLELEFRHDLLLDAEGAGLWASRCAGWLEVVMEERGASL